jgi:hypothetical protein
MLSDDTEDLATAPLASAEGETTPAGSAGNPDDRGPTPAEAMADLMAWHARHCHNTAISRNTDALNCINAYIAAIRAVIVTVKE